MNRRTALVAALLSSLTVLACVPYSFKTLKSPPKHVVEDVSYTKLIQDVEAGKVVSAGIIGSTTVLYLRGGAMEAARTPPGTHLTEEMVAHGVDVRAMDPGPTSTLGPMLLDLFLRSVAFIAVIVISMLVITRLTRGTGSMGFGRSKAQVFKPGSAGDITFADVAGAVEPKQELGELIDFLKAPDRYQKVGMKVPRGALLIGPPGTGKTMLARAAAGEAGVTFMHLSGSDFVEMFVGVGPARVRSLFEAARKAKPCIIFIDEIDAIGGQRGNGFAGSEERERTLNEILVRMDGFASNEGVVVIAATNRSDMLDAALLRRFDRHIHVGVPDLLEREEIFKKHLASRKVSIDATVDAHSLARMVPGFSGDDIQKMVNEALVIAMRDNRDVVTQLDFDAARDRITMGQVRSSLRMALTREDMLRTAYHEAGHALCATLLPGCNPVRRATIIPRGGALGFVLSAADRDTFSITRRQALDTLTMTMGGRAAETIIYGSDEVGNGAAGDIASATKLAHSMVCSWGMSESVGPVAIRAPSGIPDGIASSSGASDAADAAINALVRQALRDALLLIEGNRDAFLRLTEALMERETLDGDEVRDIIAGRVDAGIQDCGESV